MNRHLPFRWSSAALSDMGKVRSLNEDAYLDLPAAGLWAVADGMGGHRAGDVASRRIVEALTNIEVPTLLSAYVDQVEERVLTVNQELLKLAESDAGSSTIGSTVVVLLAWRSHVVCLWAGDSRAYLFREGRLRQMTRDHSEVEDLIAQGLLLRADADSHPAVNVITRAVGAEANLCFDIAIWELRDADRYLLCSDGLYKELSEQEIASAMGQCDCAQVCKELLERVLQKDASDNVTALVVEVAKVA